MSLGLLAESYETSSDDNEEPDSNLSAKRQICEKTEDTSKKRRTDNGIDTISSKIQKKRSTQRLPLPSSIAKMFYDQSDQYKDDPELHKGKIRSFKHEPGNWATFVYVPYEPKETFHVMVQTIIKLCGEKVNLEPVEELHLSISKTVVIRYHWIDSLTAQLQTKFSNFKRFLVCFKYLEVYTNEDRTRTFIGFKAHVGFEELKAAVGFVDECFAEFKLPPFYKPPSFHVSLAWCNGDFYNQLTQLLPVLQEACEDFVQKTGECRNIFVENILFKTGNKIFTVTLKM